MKRAVIFDFGGVIFKTVDRTPRFAWDDRLGLPHGTTESVVHNDTTWVQAQSGAIPLDEYHGDVAARLGIAPEIVPVELERDYFSGDVLDTRMVELIIRLRNNGHQVALLSNDVAELLRPRMIRMGIIGLFNPLIISSEIAVMKPYRGAYRAVLDALDMNATDTIFIDDRAENIDGATALGIHGIHYTDGMDLSKSLQPLLNTEG
ncbi:MAG: HAD family phosphatase [Chloroflexota bacterium]